MKKALILVLFLKATNIFSQTTIEVNFLGGYLYTTPYSCWFENGFVEPKLIMWLGEHEQISVIGFYDTYDNTYDNINYSSGEMKVRVGDKEGWMSTTYPSEMLRNVTRIYKGDSLLKPKPNEAMSPIDSDIEWNYRNNGLPKIEAEKNIDKKIALLEILKKDYPSKSSKIDDLIKEAKSHKQIRIPLTQHGNTRSLKAKINNTLSFDFILDTGADNVLVAPDVFITFYKAGLITDKDIKGKQNFNIADGTTVQGLKFILKEIQIDDIVLNNVEASVITGGADYDMLLGGSVFEKLGKISIDYKNSELIIEK